MVRLYIMIRKCSQHSQRAKVEIVKNKVNHVKFKFSTDTLCSRMSQNNFTYHAQKINLTEEDQKKATSSLDK